MKYHQKFIFILLMSWLAACSAKEDSTEEDESTNTPSSSSSSSNEDTSLSSSTATVTGNIAIVQENMVPGSLVVGGSSSLLLTQDDGNPCADADDFFDCQPNLLKLYMGMGKQMVGMVNQIVKEIGTGLFASVEIPNFEDADIEDCDDLNIDEEGDDVKRVQYCVKSGSDFRIILDTATGAFIYLDVDDKTYTLKFNGENAPEEDGDDGGGPGKIEAVVNYVSESEFSVNVTLAEMACDPNDVAAPGDVIIKIDVKDGVWKGKAMMYHPRWMGSGSELACTDTPTDSTAIGIYTDFVGDATNTTAAVHLLPRTVSDVANIPNYSLADICTHWPSGCNQSGAGFGSQNVLATSYQNNFCAENGAATWNTNCTSDSDAIANGSFSAASEWIIPSELKDLTVSIPEELSAE